MAEPSLTTRYRLVGDPEQTQHSYRRLILDIHSLNSSTPLEE